MQVVTLTAEQSNRARKLRNAQWMLQQARIEINGALGGTDVGDEYKLALDAMVEDLELDIDCIGTEEE